MGERQRRHTSRASPSAASRSIRPTRTTSTSRWSVAAAAQAHQPAHHRSSASGSRPTAAWNWKRVLGAKDPPRRDRPRIDPQNPNVLYASFWGDAMYRSTDGGKKWTPIMNGLPANATTTAGDPLRHRRCLTRRPARPCSTPASTRSTPAAPPVGRSGSPPTRAPAGRRCPAAPARTRSPTTAAPVLYDNVVEADPTNPNVVFVAGQFDYDIGSGGIYRSDDGGQTWKNLGWDQHPDFHAVAFNPANTVEGAIGNDGGVWSSNSRGGRPNAADPLRPPTGWTSTVRSTRAPPGVAPEQPADRAVHSIAIAAPAFRTHRAGASGAAPRTTAPAQDGHRATRGSTSAAATAARCSSTRAGDLRRSLLLLVYGTLLRHLAVPVRRTAATSSQPVDPQRDQPQRPLGLLHRRAC